MDYNENMRFLWNENKNELLKQQRKISFEQIVLSIENKQIVDVMEHPNQDKYKGQIFILVERDNYIYVVPASISESGEECHLKTIYPSRKYTNKFLRSKE
jgi:uncharacterized DUF497 family protein